MENQTRVLADTMLSTEIYRRELQRLGVHRVDLDPVAQGVRLEPSWGFTYSFYYPWSYLTGGRTCSTAALQDPLREHVILDKPCTRPCQEVNVAHVRENGIALHRGNAFFMPNTGFAEDYMNGRYPFNRLIYEPLIPI